MDQVVKEVQEEAQSFHRRAYEAWKDVQRSYPEACESPACLLLPQSVCLNASCSVQTARF